VLVVLAAVVAGVTLVRPRLRGGAGTQTLPPAPPQAPAPGGEGQAGTATAPPQAPVPGPPPLETEPAPPPLAGRMARLRGRLARSQSGFGSVLLGLLSRDALDEQGWEEIEDTLISADLGVAPA